MANRTNTTTSAATDIFQDQSEGNLTYTNVDRGIQESSSEARPDVVTTAERDRLTPELGEIIYNSDTLLSEYWNGFGWVNNAGGGGGIGEGFVPYVGATSDVDLGVNSLEASGVQLSGGTGAEGSLTWDSDQGTLDLILEGGDVVHKIGQEVLVHVKAAESISKGNVVYASGAVGASGKVLASKFKADGNVKAFLILGVATEDISQGSFGFVTQLGTVRGLDTSSYSAGDVLYTSFVSSGQLSTLVPIPPNIAMPLAFVVNAHSSNGELFVRLTPPNELAELHDVHLVEPSTGDTITYDSVAGHWDNTPSELKGRIVVTQENVLTTICGTIDPTKEYFLSGIIDLGGRQIKVPVEGMDIRGYSANTSGLVSSENNHSMIISRTDDFGTNLKSGDLIISNISIEVSGTNSKVYDLYDVDGSHKVEFNNVKYNNSTSLGNLYDYNRGSESGTSRHGGSPSLSFHGSWDEGYRLSNSIASGMSNTTTEPLFKAGTSFGVDSRFLIDMDVDLGLLQPLLDFAPSNFTENNSLQLMNLWLTRVGVINAADINITPNISSTDSESSWVNNNGVNNS